MLSEEIETLDGLSDPSKQNPTCIRILVFFFLWVGLVNQLYSLFVDWAKEGDLRGITYFSNTLAYIFSFLAIFISQYKNWFDELIIRRYGSMAVASSMIYITFYPYFYEMQLRLHIPEPLGITNPILLFFLAFFGVNAFWFGFTGKTFWVWFRDRKKQAFKQASAMIEVGVVRSVSMASKVKDMAGMTKRKNA